jgi:hypothetical protein
MKTKIKLIIAVSSILCYSFSVAQVVQLTPAQAMEEHKNEIGSTAYIFEGKVTQKKYYNGKNQVVTTCIIQITKIFKGSPQLKLGSIKVITKQAVKNGGIIVTPTDEGYVVPINKEDTYIIFCRPVNSSWCVDSTATDNNIALTTWDGGLDDPIIISGDSVNWYNTPQLKTKEDVYSFFKENGVTVQDEIKQK